MYKFIIYKYKEIFLSNLCSNCYDIRAFSLPTYQQMLTCNQNPILKIHSFYHLTQIMLIFTWTQSDTVNSNTELSDQTLLVLKSSWTCMIRILTAFCSWKCCLSKTYKGNGKKRQRNRVSKNIYEEVRGDLSMHNLPVMFLNLNSTFILYQITYIFMLLLLIMSWCRRNTNKSRRGTSSYVWYWLREKVSHRFVTHRAQENHMKSLTKGKR